MLTVHATENLLAHILIQNPEMLLNPSMGSRIQRLLLNPSMGSRISLHSCAFRGRGHPPLRCRLQQGSGHHTRPAFVSCVRLRASARDGSCFRSTCPETIAQPVRPPGELKSLPFFPCPTRCTAARPCSENSRCELHGQKVSGSISLQGAHVQNCTCVLGGRTRSDERLTRLVTTAERNGAARRETS